MKFPIKFIRNNSATILTIASVGGLVVTTISAVKAGQKAVKRLERATKEKGEELTKIEKVLNLLPVYIPTIAWGLGTATCIVGSNIINQKRQTSLIAAYSMLDTKFHQYQQTTNKLFGSDAHEKIQIEMAKDNYIWTGIFNDELTYDPDSDYSDKVIFYNTVTDSYFESTMASVLAAEYHTNRNLMIRGYVTVNDFCDFLGVKAVPWGGVMGWDHNIFDMGVCWLDFENKTVTLDDDLECIVISPNFEVGQI